jgi:hypothetical protein
MKRNLSGSAIFIIALTVGQGPIAAQCKPNPSIENGSLTWIDCMGQSKEILAVPLRSRVLPFRSTILSGRYDGNFDRTTGKLDIVWFDDTITISRPLRSYGGDIVLFADTININEPIDTRLYIQHHVDHFAPQVQWKSPATGVTGVAAKTSAYVAENPNYVSAFREYYEQCFDCYPGETRLPELPSGLGAVTPIPASGVIDEVTGGAAPDASILFDVVRSGNIYLFARTINIDPKLLHPFMPEYRFECTPAGRVVDLLNQLRGTFLPQSSPIGTLFSNPLPSVDTVQRFALNAGGITGGRGGTGSASNAPDLVHLGSVPEMYTRSGISGPPGKGGDAGSIYVTVIGGTSDQSRALQEELEAGSSVRGGLPGSNIQFRTPWTRGALAVTPSRCSFSAGGHWPAALDGADGTLSVVNKTSTDALISIAVLLSGKSLRVDYDVSTFLNLVKADRSIVSTDPMSPLTAYLAKELIQAEVKYLADVSRVLALDQPEIGEYLPTPLRDLSVQAIRESPIDKEQLAVLNTLVTFQDLDGIMTYFRNTGGLFNIGSRAAYERMSSGQLRALVALGDTTLEEIKSSLGDLNRNLFEFMTTAQANRLQNTLRDLQDKIAKAEEDARKVAQTKGGLVQIVTALSKLGGSVAKIAAAVTKDDYAAAAEALPSLGQGFQDLMDLQKLPQASDVPRLKEELATIDQQYRQLLEFVEDSRRSFLSSAQGDVFGMLRARSTLASGLVAESAQFHDLVRTAVIGYFNDPSKSKIALSTNLDAISTYLASYPEKSPFIMLRDIKLTCSASDRTCGTYPANGGQLEVASCMTFGGKARAVPLWEIAPHAGPVTVPLFGVGKTSVRELAGGAIASCARP